MKNNTKNRLLSFMLVLTMLLPLTLPMVLMFPEDLNAAAAQELDLDNGSIIISSTGFKQGGALTETPHSQVDGYTIKQTSLITNNTITIETGTTVPIKIDGINIESPSGAASAPIDLQGNADVTLTLVGENEVKSLEAKYPGIRVENSGANGIATLTIEGTDLDSLTTAGGTFGAGIGGGIDSSFQGNDGGNITINGGNVTAESSPLGSGIGSFGAGIGGGGGANHDGGDGGNITINGGNIASSSIHGAGIGAGSYAGTGGGGSVGGNILITHGVATDKITSTDGDEIGNGFNATNLPWSGASNIHNVTFYTDDYTTPHNVTYVVPANEAIFPTKDHLNMLFGTSSDPIPVTQNINMWGDDNNSTTGDAPDTAFAPNPSDYTYYAYDTIIPSVTSFIPSTISTPITTTDAVITFSEPMDITPANLGVVTINGISLTSSPTWSTDKKTVTYSFSPDVTLAYGQTYAVAISGFKDLSGNQMANTPYSFTVEAPPPVGQVIVTYYANPTIAGTVTAKNGNGNPITSGSAVTSGTTLTFKANSTDNEYSFASWTVNGNDMGSINPLTIPITEDTEVVGNFKYVGPMPIGGNNGNNSGNNNGNDNGNDNDEGNTIYASPNPIVTITPPTVPTSTEFTKAPIMIGDPDGNFRPKDSLSRAEVAQVIFNTQFDGSSAENAPFEDVDQDAWYANAVNFAYANEYMVGYPEGNFEPNASITRAEVLEVFDNIMEYSDYEGTDIFTDISDHWANEQINAAASDMGLLGYPDGSFKPDDDIIRADFAIMLAMSTDRDVSLNEFTPNDVYPTDYYYEYVMAVVNYSKEA